MLFPAPGLKTFPELGNLFPAPRTSKHVSNRDIFFPRPAELRGAAKLELGGNENKILNNVQYRRFRRAGEGQIVPPA